jgi:hypothetical protein
MRPTPPTLADILLRPGSAIRGLLGQLRPLAAADLQLREALGSPFYDRVRLANVRNDRAIIYVDSASTLTLLRFRQHELIQILAACDGIQCQRLEFRIAPGLFRL